MDDSMLPPLFAEYEHPETRDPHSLDVDSDSGVCDDENNDQASRHDQAILSENLGLIETESDLLCSRSHTVIHPAYKELREKYIRLLKILPVQADRAIHCRLEEFSLDDKPTYTAISYTWGSQHGAHAVFVNDHSLLVPKNLWRFLDSARSMGGDLSSWLWIDMLSINQADISERGHQVSLMPVIFRTANLVNVWLGPAYLGSDAALIALARIGNHWKSLGQRRKVWASHLGSGIRDLCQRPYWKRLWVYQELKLARNIQLMCGTRTIAWDEFRLFLSLVSLAETDLFAKIPSLSSFVRDSIDSPAMRMAKLTSKSVHTHLWSLIHATQHLRCADLMDKVYALLGVSTEGHENIKPDYDLPIPTLINKILLEVYKLYPPESLEEALAQCDEVEDILAVPRGTVFTIRGQRGSYEVPSEADFRACRLGAQDSSLSLWWTAFYGHVAVQRLLLSAWQVEHFASDPSVDESLLTWEDTAVARNIFRTCAIETLSLDPRLSHYASSFKSRYDAVEGTLLKGKPDAATDQLLPQEKHFEGLIRSFAGGDEAQSFKILLAPGGFLASEDDGVVALLRAYAVHHDKLDLLLGLHKAGFVDDVTESRFFRSAVPSRYSTERHDPFLGLDAEKISSHHHEYINRSAHYELPREQRSGKSPMNVVRLPLLSYFASRPTTSCISYFLQHSSCDMEVQDENGWTPLIWATRYGNVDFIKTVLYPDEPLCDLNYSDPNGWTAYEHAAAFSDTHIMFILIARKAFDHNAVDSNGRTRLLRAIENCDLPLARILVKKEECDPNIPDNKGRTPLTLAVSRCRATFDSEDSTTDSGDSTTVSEDLNATSAERSDSMKQAHMQTTKRALEYRELIALLLRRRNINVNMQDGSGRSALLIASALGLADVVKLLLRAKGCAPGLPSQNGDTSHSLALSSGHKDVVRLFEDNLYVVHDFAFEL
jgi:ankyrin repeat protein